MSDFWKLLAENGITGGQLIAFLLTIVAAFFSARWGGAESRRQFAVKQTFDRRSAALSLIPLLLKFAAACETKRSNLSLFISSEGHDGQDEGMQGLDIDPAIRASASQLSAQVAERTIKLEVIKDRAVAYFAGAAGFEDEDDLNDQLLSFFALLALKARYLIDLAAKDAALRPTHPEADMAELLKAATKHGYLIDSGDELRWY